MKTLTLGLVLWALPALAQTTTPDPQPLIQPQDQWALVLHRQAPEALAAFQDAMRGPSPMTVDPTLSTKGGRITLQIHETITASSALTVDQWEIYLQSQWPAVMAKVAKRLIAGKYTILGLASFPKTTEAMTWGPERGISLRFTRSSTTLTAHVDILAGK